MSPLTKEVQEEIKLALALERAKVDPSEPTLVPEPITTAEPAPTASPFAAGAAPLPAPPPARARKDGAAKLICNDSGKRVSCLANAVSILRGFDRQWLNVLGYDEFSNAIVTRKSPPWGGTVGPWTSSDDVRAADYLNHVGIFVSSKVAAQAADIAARDSSFHPIREFLRSLKWDRTPRLDNWLSTYLGAEASAWTKAAGSRWLISGVARVMQPGCQADYLLLLVGPQGAMKSSALQILAGDRWFRDHISSITSKDCRIELQGKWLVELGELAAKRNSTHEAMKSFLTCRIDSFRPVYGTRVVDYPRQAIFSASTNSRDSLSDITGNRRYWPVSVGAINLEALRRDRSQLWAEAFARFQSAESWWLTTKELNGLAEAEQDKNYSAGAYDDRILNWCSNPRGGGETMRSVRGKVIASEISELALGVDMSAPHFTRVQREIRDCLTHHRWTSRQERIPGTNQRARFWSSPDQE